MSGELTPEAERELKLEERAERLRAAMYRVPGLLDRLSVGRDAAKRACGEGRPAERPEADTAGAEQQ